MGDRCRIRKSMLDEGADGGIAVGHSSARIPRTYTESKKSTGDSPGIFHAWCRTHSNHSGPGI
jgi:hypothetical protein